MAKQVVFIPAEGEPRALDTYDWQTLRKLIGGYLELVRVLDRIGPDGQWHYSIMFIDEDGFSKELARNPRATEIYQRNARTQFPRAENPFLAIAAASRQQWEGMGAFVISGEPHPGYDADPYIVGPAVYFEGWTQEEIDAWDATCDAAAELDDDDGEPDAP